MEGRPTAASALVETSVGKSDGDAYITVAAQRDKLRQRLIALEEASSSEIHRLKMEVNALKSEQQQQHGGNPFSIAMPPSASAEMEESRRPLILFQHGRLQLTPEAALDLIDRGNMLLSRYVLSSLLWRRCLVGYLAVIHLYLCLSLLLRLLIG
jgi:hypothetical protein